MIIPDDIVETGISLKDGYFDLKGLSAYSSLAVPTLRDYIKDGALPCFKAKGKILIKRSEFDEWMEARRLNREKDINGIVEEVMEGLKQ